MAEYRKQWTTEETISLIEAYREHPNLWNPENQHYKNKVKKVDSLKELARVFRTSVQEVERKIRNVNSQYQRERRSDEQMKISGTDHNFKAKWFGYSAMSFLHDINVIRRSNQFGDFERSAESEMNESESLESNIEDFPEEGSYLAEMEAETEQPVLEPTTPKKLPRRTHVQTMDRSDWTLQISDETKNVVNKPQKDEFTVFGEYIAYELRSITDPISVLHAKKRIQDALYEVKLQFLENCNRNASTSHTTPNCHGAESKYILPS